MTQNEAIRMAAREILAGIRSLWTVAPYDRPYWPGFGLEVLPEDTPQFTGDWRDSLAVRPGYKEGK